jgi:hypothetical protein
LPCVRQMGSDQRTCSEWTEAVLAHRDSKCSG